MGYVKTKKMQLSHIVHTPNATGFKDLENGQFIWENVTWTKCWCGCMHSNRFTPKSFWNKKWEVPAVRHTAGILLWKKQKQRIKLFLVQSYGKFYGIPKGHAEPGESSKVAALREFREETGTEIDDFFDRSKNRAVGKITEIKKSLGPRSIFSIFVVRVPWKFSIDTLPDCDNEITSLGFVDCNILNMFRLNRITKETINGVDFK